MAGSLVLGSVQPASAVSAGVASGTEDQIDVGDPPVNGTLDTGMTAPTVGPLGVCARAQDDDYVDPVTGPDGDLLSAKYTLNATDSSLGAITITIETTARFFFGPQGTHYNPPLVSVTGADCSAANLGPLAPIPATVTVSGGASCSGNGSFWRAAADGFGITATLNGGTCSGTLNFLGVYQPPCGLPFAACINGAYTLQ